MLNDLMEGNKRMGWEGREPHAYWKGNPNVATTRQDLLKCNVSDKQDWGARVYAQVIIIPMVHFNFIGRYICSLPLRRIW